MQRCRSASWRPVIGAVKRVSPPSTAAQQSWGATSTSVQSVDFRTRVPLDLMTRLAPGSAGQKTPVSKMTAAACPSASAGGGARRSPRAHASASGRRTRVARAPPRRRRRRGGTRGYEAPSSLFDCGRSRHTLPTDAPRRDICKPTPDTRRLGAARRGAGAPVGRWAVHDSSCWTCGHGSGRREIPAGPRQRRTPCW
jgi:hypothetical protein